MSAVSNTPADDDQIDEPIFPDQPVTGRTISRYINAQHYNDGIFSEVFRAIDSAAVDGNGKPTAVALKITTPSVMTPPHDSRREARILAATKGDYIIPLLDTFQQAGGHFVLVFPFMPYGLDGLLRHNRLVNSSRRQVIHDLFSGLAHIHAHGIIHRDIKPSNILLASPTGPAYISDFGIAWSPDDVASEPEDEKTIDVGTTCYRPPELLFGHQAYGTKLDMWAAGCVVAQITCLGGKTLFDAGDLGSELALIRSIFETLGTPDLKVWPEAADFSDWGKMNFTRYPGKQWDDVLPGGDPDAVRLVSQLVVFESGERLSADQVLEHRYLH